MDIDIVYTWVDGNDPAWIARRDACLGTKTVQSDAFCKGRYADNDELKYSLRSIEKYAPWIRNIFIVTDRQVPAWLDTSNPRIRIVDHSEIMPDKCRPTFSANVIEHHIANIPGLAEHFLFANDDTLLCKPVTPATFFAPDGLPIMRFFRLPFNRIQWWLREKVLRKPLNNYKSTIRNSERLVAAHYGRHFTDRSHHNIDSYLKSSYAHTREIFNEQIEPTLTNHIRSNDDFQRHLYSYAALAEGKAHRKYVDKHTSFRFNLHNPGHYRKLLRLDPTFLCMNDSKNVTDEERLRGKEILAELFPEKSQFEK